jgi:2-keto-4-pentenoate hydratase/2-oxohepta-3-ene-1,7-dioic acid hydratase in catechol pathway
MRIANVVQRGRPKVVVSDRSGEWLDLTAALASRQGAGPESIQQLLDAGAFSPETWRSLVEGKAERFAGAGLTFRPPFSRPGQIIALARNYTAHAQESTLPAPREPIFFSKANTSVVGPGDPVILPPNLGRIEPEIELAFVISSRASHVSGAAADRHIAGYTILNDVSAQELQAREIRESYPLFRCKSLETFTPMGPWVVTVDEIGMEPALAMTLRVNGKPRVSANTGGLTFGIAQLLEFISGYVALYPGDVITTGCPRAAGAICPGDEMELEIEGIGILHNPVIAGTEPCPT